MSGERDLEKLVAGMRPARRHDAVVMVTLPTRPSDVEVLATVREDEGLTVVVEQTVADEHGWDYDVALRWITLQIHSALDAVGLTAAFSAALAEAGISCNVLAGRFHDHLLVPVRQADVAMDVLAELSRAEIGRL